MDRQYDLKGIQSSWLDFTTTRFANMFLYGTSKQHFTNMKEVSIEYHLFPAKLKLGTNSDNFPKKIEYNGRISPLKKKKISQEIVQYPSLWRT